MTSIQKRDRELKRRIDLLGDDQAIMPRSCRVCGCTEEDCTLCIIATSRPCYWAELDLCSACVPAKTPAERRKKMNSLLLIAENFIRRAAGQVNEKSNSAACVARLHAQICAALGLVRDEIKTDNKPKPKKRATHA